MTHNIFPVLPINNLINQDGEQTTPHKLAIGTKPPVSNPRVLFCPCVVRKETTQVDGKVLNTRHQRKKRFWGILVGIQQQQKGYLIYVPSAQKIFSSYDIALDGKK